MNIKIHRTKHSLVVAICDKELIGKKIEDKDLSTNLTKRFYNGEDVPEKRVIEILKDADSINLVGKEAIRVGLKANVIRKENIKKTQPF